MASAVIAVRARLAQQRPDVKFVTKTTSNLEVDLPQVRIVGAGGPMKMTLAAEHLIIETFHADELSAILLAHEVNDLLAFHACGVTEDAVISRVRVDSVPSPTPYQNPKVSQQVSRCTVWIRSAN